MGKQGTEDSTTPPRQNNSKEESEEFTTEASDIAKQLQTEQFHITELGSRADTLEHGLNESYAKAKQMLEEAAMLKEKLQKQLYDRNSETQKGPS